MMLKFFYLSLLVFVIPFTARAENACASLAKHVVMAPV